MRSPAKSLIASNARRCVKNSIGWCGSGWRLIRTSRRKNEGQDLTRMSDDLNDLYQEVILDHCRHPRNFREMGNPSCTAQGHNPLCGDQLKLYLLMEGEVVKEISFV